MAASRFEIGVGTVVFSLPFANCIVVEFAGRLQRPVLVGSPLGHSGHGGRQTVGILPGTRVACLLGRDSDTEAYLIHALPDPVGDTGKAPLEFMQQGGGSTAYTEGLLYDMIFAAAKPFTFAHHGTPVDLQPGEWSLLNDFGGGLGLERFAAWIRASEFCAVYADSLTDTLRTIARTQVEQTSTRSDIDTMLGAVPTRLSMRALFGAEAYGLQGGNIATVGAAFAATNSSSTGVAPGSGEIAGQDVGRLGDTELLLAPRLIDAESSVIGGAHRSVVVPNFIKNDNDVFVHIGGSTTMLREFRGLDGVYSVESRRGIHLWKTATIAAPVASSAEPAAGGIEDRGYSVDPFVLDEKMYGDLGLTVAAYEHHAFLAGLGAGTPGTGSVATAAPLPNTNKQWQPVLADAGDAVVVSPLAAPVKYYRVSAGIDIMADGSVVITDAWGAQIIMTGGNIMMSAPGDIYQTPGRNAVIMATGDIIARAKNDVDVSSSQGSVRVKAEINLTALAGNSGVGGMLFESRGVNSALVAAAGKKAVLGGIALKSATDIVEIAEGGIKREAAQLADTADELTAAIPAVNYATSAFIIGTDKALYAFSSDMLTIPGGVVVQGYFQTKSWTRLGGVVFVEKGGLFSIDDIQTMGAVAANGVVVGQYVVPHGEPPDSDKLPVKDALGIVDKTTKTTPRATLNAAEKRAVDYAISFNAQIWGYYNTGIGARYTPAVVAALAFSFRYDLEYLGRSAGSGFTLPAALWQQRFYATAGAGGGWREPVVKFGEVATAPYPGFEAWTAQGNDADKHGLVLLATATYHDPSSQGYADTATPGAFATKNVPFIQYPTPTT